MKQHVGALIEQRLSGFPLLRRIEPLVDPYDLGLDPWLFNPNWKPERAITLADDPTPLDILLDQSLRIYQDYGAGKFLLKDPQKALEYFQKAAAQGDNDARQEVLQLTSSGSQPLTVTVTKDAFENGQKLAAEKKFAEAAKYYRQAAEEG